MSRQSGFVPIRFHLVGKLLLGASVLGLLAVGIAALTGWFSVPGFVMLMSLAALPVSLYLIFVAPSE